MKDNNLIDTYKNLIWKIAGRFYGVEKDDLFQAGALGLLKALNNYKSDSGAKFSTYATNYIFGEMYLLTTNRNMKYSKDMLKLYKLIESTRYKLAQIMNKIPSNNELANYLEIPISDIEYATTMALEIMSLDSNQEESRSIHEMVEGKGDNIDERLFIEDSLDHLSESEKEIIKARYYEDLTQGEIARKLQMTQVMVSRIEKRGKEKLREYMTL